MFSTQSAIVTPSPKENYIKQIKNSWHTRVVLQGNNIRIAKI